MRSSLWLILLFGIATAQTQDGKVNVFANASSQILDCFFPESCRNGTCTADTNSPACETCAEDFYRLESVCLGCGTRVPWAVILFILVLAVIVFIGARGAYPLPVVIKVKMLVDFLQLLLLSLKFRSAWPSLTTFLLDKVTFVYLNAQMVNLECFVSSLNAYYIAWLSSTLPMLLVFIAAIIADICLGKRSEEKRGMLTFRSSLRRFLFQFLLVVYAPVTSLVIRSYACENNISANNTWIKSTNVEDKWIYNQNISCSQSLFQAVTFSSIFFLIFFSFLFPVIILFFTIRLRRFKLLKRKKAFFGAVYECYKPAWCFTEGIILLRKLVIIGLTDVYPVKPLVQITVSTVLSFGYLLMVIFGKPYRPGNWRLGASKVDVHNSFEVVTSAVVFFVQASSLLLLYHFVETAIDWMAMVVISLTIVIWLIIHFGQILLEEIPVEKVEKPEEIQENQNETETHKSDNPWAFLKIKKDGLTASELQHRELAMAEF